MKKIDRDKLEQTYGIHKFKVPNKEEQISAMGLSGESTLFKKFIMLEFKNYYNEINVPLIGDWLMSNKEYGQTFNEYMNKGIVPITEERSVIYLAPLNFADNTIDQSFISAILILTEAYFYGMKVKILEGIDICKYEQIKNSFRQVNGDKLQINAHYILKILNTEIPSDAFCLIGFTDKDLYNEANIIKPRNYIYKHEYNKEQGEESFKSTNSAFCYGLSYTKNRVGVFSFARYDPLFYSIKYNTEDNNKSNEIKEKEKLSKYYFILLKRACKVVTKEVSHMFGLKNCIYFCCNLNGFNSMEEFDKRPLELCPICVRKLYANISLKWNDKVQYNRLNNPMIIYDRLNKMFEVIFENFEGLFSNELVWYKSRIELLKNEI